MKTTWVKKASRGLLLAGLVGAGIALGGCADEYAAYPGYYHGGYYAGYSAPYYGAYGYPYRPYGPYYGGYYGAPYYGYSPYYGGGSVVVSSGRSYVSGNRTYVYRDRYGRVIRRSAADRTRRTTTRPTYQRQRATRAPQYQNDDERRYYPER
jgi:hypothetical protein